ncbi:hypothetical protein [Salinibacterium sp. PAMC 21357]|uniref:hypothetical protein n=1 Tax=Salinibacterium sp. PAMC 21357 TaxID=1112215 RepID=UPI0002892635|nr:hypothetical protein [Salinibacterium sp. PAMC 21357]
MEADVPSTSAKVWPAPELPTEAQAGLQLLQRGFRTREALEDRVDALTVTFGSALAADRDTAPYNAVPDMVQNALNNALDHLHALQVSVAESGGKLLAMSSFTLIRSAYEALGTGLWILQPESSDQRLLRSRQLLRSNRLQLQNMQYESGKSDPGFERVEATLQRQLDSLPSLANPSVKKLSSVTIRLREIADLVPELKVPPLILWQKASGIAHNNTYMMTAVLEKEKIELPDGSPNAYRVSSSFGMVAFYYDSALKMLEALLGLYDQRNRV